MKFTAERSSILPALTRVAGIVNRVNISAVLGNILIDAMDDRVTVRATNLDMEATATFAANVSINGAITLQSTKLLDCIKSLAPGSDVQISHGPDDPRAKVKSGRSNFTIPSLPANLFPQFSGMDDGDEIEMVASVLRASLDLTSFAMMTGEKWPVLHSVYMKDGKMVATNTHKMAVTKTPYNGTFSAILPTDFVNQATRVLTDLAGDVTMRTNGRLVRLSSDAMTLTGKVMDGQYVEYERAIPPAVETKLAVGREALISAIRRAMIMSDRTSSVRLHITSDALRVSSRAEDRGEADDEIAAEWNGEETVIGFNGTSLIEVLSRIKTETVEAEISDRGAVFKDEVSVFVVGPLRG